MLGANAAVVDDEAEVLRQELRRPLYRVARLEYRLVNMVPGAITVLRTVYRFLFFVARHFGEPLPNDEPVDGEVKALRDELQRPLYKVARLQYWLARKTPGAAAILRATYGLASILKRRLRKRPPEDAAVAAYLANLALSNSSAYPLAERWYDAECPEVSIIILNWQKAALTAQCLHEIWKHTSGARYEVIVLDNGSGPSSLEPLLTLRLPFRFIRLAINRLFGEGNNIAAEAAHGRLLVFMNNDAFVTSGWLGPLVEAMKEPDVGAVGPMFRYPNGLIQECGALITRDGEPTKIGNMLRVPLKTMMVPRDVHYISAACLLLEKSVFLGLDGFSLDFEPAYYEDVDLCFRMRRAGRRVRYIPSSQVTHIENYSHKEDSNAMAASVSINRDRFMDRHRDMLGDAPSYSMATAPNIETVPTLLAAGARLRVGIYTPFELTPGGGERYILTLASIFGATLITGEAYSQARLRQLGKAFGLDVSTVRLLPYSRAIRQSFDLFFSIGNQIVPDVPAMADTSLYICQFPFPVPCGRVVDGMRLLDGYQAYIAYSEYAKDHIARSQNGFGLKNIPVHVVYPPCTMQTASRSAPHGRPVSRILSVGRFFEGGHCKNHHLLVRLFRELIGDNVEMHIVGSLHPSSAHMEYFRRVRKLAEGAPVFLHPNADAKTLAELYKTSQIYWHGAGLGVDSEVRPEAMEHFGMSIVEAMGSGCVPVVFGRGGPAEIVSHKNNGLLFNSGTELVDHTRFLLQNREVTAKLSQAARMRAQEFSVDHFVARLREIVPELTAAGAIDRAI